MAKHWNNDDDDDDDEPDGDDPDDDGTVPCPHCGASIPEDAIRCVYCENYISAIDAPAGLPRWWIMLGIVLCLVIVALWIAMR